MTFKASASLFYRSIVPKSQVLDSKLTSRYLQLRISPGSLNRQLKTINTCSKLAPKAGSMALYSKQRIKSTRSLWFITAESGIESKEPKWLSTSHLSSASESSCTDATIHVQAIAQQEALQCIRKDSSTARQLGHASTVYLTSRHMTRTTRLALDPLSAHPWQETGELALQPS